MLIHIHFINYPPSAERLELSSDKYLDNRDCYGFNTVGALPTKQYPDQDCARGVDNVC